MNTKTRAKRLEDLGFGIPAIEVDHEGKLRGGFLAVQVCLQSPSNNNGDCGCKTKAQCGCSKTQCGCESSSPANGEEVLPGSGWHLV